MIKWTWRIIRWRRRRRPYKLEWTTVNEESTPPAYLQTQIKQLAMTNMAGKYDGLGIATVSVIFLWMVQILAVSFGYYLLYPHECLSDVKLIGIIGGWIPAFVVVQLARSVPLQFPDPRPSWIHILLEAISIITLPAASGIMSGYMGPLLLDTLACKRVGSLALHRIIFSGAVGGLMFLPAFTPVVAWLQVRRSRQKSEAKANY
ncbi:hypothetical protein BD410DRAFT_885727 [Rickenella mellea]|uniref:Uncharacterized protein n=1 Tax=Rickenella mellea TaxID=50990 RepID=A0A4Y7PQS9_9AGAM|nr:hypothetical protein BD410DRAFT_885727 [Rickenella mellea]